MKTIQEWAKEQIILIESEQNTEYQETISLYKQLGERELQNRGLCLIVRLTILKSGIGGSTLLTFEAGVGGMEMLPQNKFRVGDVVSIKKHVSAKKAKDNEEEQELSGTVCRISDTMLVVAIKQDLPNDLSDLFRISKLANDISYKRMIDAMKWLEKQDERPSDLVRVLTGQTTPSRTDSSSELVFFDDTLNAPQKEAVKSCLDARDLHLIHGPPGTGKTHTCVEVIRQLVHQKLRVLVCGPSNISVDNLVERLSKFKLDIVRIGHPARVLESVLQYALDVRIHSSNQGEIVLDVKKELDHTLNKASKAKRKSDRYKLYQEAKTLRAELKTRERTVLASTIKNAQVVLCTLNGAASKILNQEEFDVLLIDEASQALEAESWIAIQKTKKLILAGDHLQLPPTIQSKGKVEKALSFTLFERMLKIHGETVKTLLNVQYRMNNKIMQFASDHFYDGKLVCGPKIENRLLIDLEKVQETEETSVPLVFFDTAGHDLLESADEEDSKFNDGEVQIVKDYILDLVKAGVSDSDIVVISPYSAQISKLKLALNETYPKVELGTVDGIQGREKEVVILSLVRSNSQGQVGFLKESRRLNVALTRPKRHLCVIGDSQTLQRNEFLSKMVVYLEENAEIRYPGA